MLNEDLRQNTTKLWLGSPFWGRVMSHEVALSFFENYHYPLHSPPCYPHSHMHTTQPFTADFTCLHDHDQVEKILSTEILVWRLRESFLVWLLAWIGVV